MTDLTEVEKQAVREAVSNRLRDGLVRVLVRAGKWDEHPAMKDAFLGAQAVLPSPAPLSEGVKSAVTGTRWRHKKRGTTYTVVGLAVAQAPDDCPIADFNGVVVYRCESDGQLWVRHIHEFEDGRFEQILAQGVLSSLAPPAEAGERENH